jgi:pyruvate/oxaloacetate carboxyltransferase
MNKLFFGIIGVAAIGIGVFVVGQMYKTPVTPAEVLQTEQKMMDEKMTNSPAAAAEKTMDEIATTTEEVMMDNSSDDMMKKADVAREMEKDDVTMKKPGIYTKYDEGKLAMANTGDVVLFFKAAWCPSCRTLDAALVAEAANIPSDLTILEVDYDTAVELKKKYGVTTQHTLVQVDASGTMITKWSGGSTLASVVAKVQ